MFPVVPCLLALFAPLQATGAAPVTPPAAVVVPNEWRTRLDTAGAPLDPEQMRLVMLLVSPPAPPVPVAGQIVVPDECRTQLTEFAFLRRGTIVLPQSTPAAPAAAVPPPESLYVTVRKRLRNESLAPSVAATLLVESAVENERVGHHNLAREDIDLALQRDPTHAEALRMRTKCRFDARDYRGALRDAEAHLATCPADRSARYDRANLLVWCDRSAEAHRELTALIREYPGRAEYYASRAAASRLLGRDQDSDLDSEIAVELAPGDSTCRLSRMKNRLAVGDLAGAYDQYLAGFRGDPVPATGSPELRVAVEFLALAHEHFEKDSAHAHLVLAQLDWMVKACPESNPSRHLLAVEYLRASRPDLAEQVATDALDRNPTDARAFSLRGKARAALGYPDAALDLATALGLEDFAETRAELVKLHRAVGRRAEARDLAEVGVELHPACGACRQFLADDDLRRGDFAAAERHATCALWLAHDRVDATAARLTRLLARLAQLDLEAAADDYARLPVNEDVTVPQVTLELD